MGHIIQALQSEEKIKTILQTSLSGYDLYNYLARNKIKILQCGNKIRLRFN